MSRVVVTGGAGFIGRHLVHDLTERGHEVIAFDNLRRSQRPLSATFVEGDIRNRRDLQSAFAGVDTVFHLAAQSNVLGAAADAEYSVTTNVAGTVNVLEAARDAGVKRVVFTSSREVYGEVSSLPVLESTRICPKNGYGASKAAAEIYCSITAGVDVRILRLANVYGPGDRDRVIPLFVEAALAGRPLTIFGGENKLLDFVWIGDVVAALAGAAEVSSLEGPVNIGSGRGTTLYELAQKVLELTGSSSAIVDAPGRGIEVDKYVAAIGSAERSLAFQPSPKWHGLEEMIELLQISRNSGAASLPQEIGSR